MDLTQQLEYSAAKAAYDDMIADSIALGSLLMINEASWIHGWLAGRVQTAEYTPLPAMFDHLYPKAGESE